MVWIPWQEVHALSTQPPLNTMGFWWFVHVWTWCNVMLPHAWPKLS
jgi:hypothetical protein